MLDASDAVGTRGLLGEGCGVGCGEVHGGIDGGELVFDVDALAERGVGNEAGRLRKTDIETEEVDRACRREGADDAENGED